VNTLEDLSVPLAALMEEIVKACGEPGMRVDVHPRRHEIVWVYVWMIDGYNHGFAVRIKDPQSIAVEIWAHEQEVSRAEALVNNPVSAMSFLRANLPPALLGHQTKDGT
jgi:hypothetical protein